jgi:hypothetical protein
MRKFLVPTLLATGMAVSAVAAADGNSIPLPPRFHDGNSIPLSSGFPDGNSIPVPPRFHDGNSIPLPPR